MSGSVTYASTETVLMPAAFASSRAGLSASGSFGLNTIASTSAAIRSRMSCSWPAASVLRWIGGQLGDLAGGQRLGLGRADLLLAEAVADAATVRVADLVLRRRARRRAQTAPPRSVPAALGAAALGAAVAAPACCRRPRTPRPLRGPRAVLPGSISFRSCVLLLDERRAVWPRRGTTMPPLTGVLHPHQLGFTSWPGLAAPSSVARMMARAMRRACSS